MMMMMMTGWWFGTMEIYDFPYGNFIIPTDEVIFFREVETIKQVFFFRLVNYCMISPEMIRAMVKNWSRSSQEY
jgi:hypothetical protein